MDKNESFQNLFRMYKKAFPQKQPGVLQQETILFWNNIKNTTDFEKSLNSKLLELSNLARIKKCSLLQYWSKTNSSKITSSNLNLANVSLIPNNDRKKIDDCLSKDKLHESSSSNVIAINNNDKKVKTSSQDSVTTKINILRQDILGLTKRRNANLLSTEQHDELKVKKLELESAEKKLREMKKSQERSAKYRQSQKRKLKEIFDECPEVRSKLQKNTKPGRPSIASSNTDQPDLLKVISDIATYGSAADDRRRTDVLRCVKTLDQLTEVINKEFGFNISRSGVYLRLVPRKANSREGKRHITTVPVKLLKSYNEAHSKHVDAKFATASINRLEELASLLGPKNVFFISQDDKARVPIGITAAKTQTPLLMHMEYCVTLPDHDWVVAPSHKLIPSVYAGITIKENGFGNREAVTYSGPTYIAIRSGKHSSSTAYSHALDIDKIFQLPEFENLIKTEANDEIKSVKPIGIFTVDGGPDENPRYMKVITSAVHHFLNYDLDALYIVCNAPGRSAFNRVERRMAPLSKELSGVILPYDHSHPYGTHLNNQGQTIDDEKENFTFAGKTLSEIWSSMIIDNYPVLSEYVLPENSELDESMLMTKSMQWHSIHVRSSQYFLRIVKCLDTKCCTPFRSPLLKIIPNRFMPPPIPMMQNAKDFTTTVDNVFFPSLFISTMLEQTTYYEWFTEFNQTKRIPYDVMCPSVKKSINDKICKKCGVYHASLTYLKKHLEFCNKKNIDKISKVRPVRIAAMRQKEFLAIIRNIEEEEDCEWIDEEFIEKNLLTEADIFTKENNKPNIISLETHLTSPWE